MNTRWVIPVFFAFLAACGVPDSTKLSEMTADDWDKVCKDTEEETFTCEDGEGSFSITVGGSAAECRENGEMTSQIPDSCEATIGDYQDCIDALREALRENPCLTDSPSECDWLNECSATDD